jgi:hypothetical protein
LPSKNWKSDAQMLEWIIVVHFCFIFFNCSSDELSRLSF